MNKSYIYLLMRMMRNNVFISLLCTSCYMLFLYRDAKFMSMVFALVLLGIIFFQFFKLMGFLFGEVAKLYVVAGYKAKYATLSGWGRIVASIASFLIPTVVLLGVKQIDYLLIYSEIAMNEPVYIRNINASSVGKPFKYRSFNMGKVGGYSRLVIYDESDQIALAAGQRSPEWWGVSRMAQEAGDTCISPATALFSHFYLIYADCR